MDNCTIQNCAVVILAAGKSKRLGSPKQLVLFEGKTLLNRAIDTAVQTNFEKIFVVLGSNFENIKASIINKNVSILKNVDFEEGMASSICCGINEIMANVPPIEFVICMVCDQPFVNSDLVLNLISAQNNSGLPIVASQYRDVLGTPALFHITMFEELLKLKGDAGAGKLIKQNLQHVAIVPFEKGIIDIDTVNDLHSIN